MMFASGWVDGIRKKTANLTYGIQRKIFLTGVLAGFVFIFLISLVLYRLMSANMKDFIYDSLSKTNGQVASNLDLYVEDMEKVLLTLSNDTNLPYITDDLYYGTFEQYLAYRDYFNVVNSLVFFKGYDTLYLYMTSEGRIISQNSSETVRYPSPESITGTTVYKAMAEGPSRFVLIPDFERNGSKGKYFAEGMRLNREDGYQNFIMLSADKAILTKYLLMASSDSFDCIAICDTQDNIILSSNPQILDPTVRLGAITDTGSLVRIQIDGVGLLATSTISTRTGWKIISLVDEDSVDGELRKLNLKVSLITALFYLLFLFSLFVVSSRASRNIRNLAHLMRNAESSNYSIRADIRSNDEIGELGSSFNFMMKEVLRNQVLEREAEIKALQQQINPHFLYNTLDVISLFIMKKRNDEAYVLVERLGEVFRYNIVKEGENLVPIRSEIDNIRNYLDIMSVRYNGRLKVEFNVDERIMQFRTLKFILQPIVENALNHGFKHQEDGYFIAVRGILEAEDILLEVEDNGCGMDPADMASLQANIEGAPSNGLQTVGTGIGMRNIDMRLKLTFGEKYGLRISAGCDSGMKVTVKMPRVAEETSSCTE